MCLPELSESRGGVGSGGSGGSGGGRGGGGGGRGSGIGRGSGRGIAPGKSSSSKGLGKKVLTGGLIAAGGVATYAAYKSAHKGKNSDISRQSREESHRVGEPYFTQQSTSYSRKSTKGFLFY